MLLDTGILVRKGNKIVRKDYAHGKPVTDKIKFFRESVRYESDNTVVLVRRMGINMQEYFLITYFVKGSRYSVSFVVPSSVFRMVMKNES